MLIRKMILLIALVTLMTLYFWGHNVGEQAITLSKGLAWVGSSLVILASTFALLMTGGGIGRIILKRQNLSASARAEQIVIESALGLGIISLLMLMLGLLGLYNETIWWALRALLLVGVILGWRWFADLRSLISKALQPTSTWGKLSAIISTILLVVAFLLAIAPPFAWDGMNYHLPIPADYIREGRIFANPDNHFYGFPQNSEMLYTLLIAVTGSDSTPAVLHGMTGVLALLAIASIIYRHTSEETAYASLLILLGSFSLWSLFSRPYVDLTMVFYGTVAILSLYHWQETSSERWIILAGILAGLALGTKYTALVLIMGMVIYILWNKKLQAIRPLIILTIATTVAFLPWMIKGLWLYQNPLYPYLFGGLNWDHFRSDNFSGSGDGLLVQPFIQQVQLLFLPIAATIFGSEHLSPYTFTSGVWLFSLPLGLPLVWQSIDDRAKKLAHFALPFAITLWIYWLVLAATSGIGSQPRLLLVAIAPVVILGSITFYGIGRLPLRPLNVGFIFRVIFVFTLFMSGFDYLRHISHSRVIDYTAGTINRDQYLARNLGNYANMMTQLDTLPEGSTVLFLWESKTYYCPEHIHCIPDLLNDQWMHPVMQGTSADQVMDDWQQSGINYVMLFDSLQEGEDYGYDFWLNWHDYAFEINSLFPENRDRELQAIWTDDFAYTLYTWRE